MEAYRRTRWLLMFACAFVYLYSFPYFSALRSANELPRIFLTQQMIDAGTFNIDARLGELGSRFDVSITPDGHHYSNKAPGLSFLAVPPYLLLKGVYAVVGGKPSLAVVTWVFRVGTVTLPSLLFLPFFLLVARRFADQAASRGALAALALGSMALPYAILFISHQVAAASAGAAFCCALLLVRDGPRRRDLFALAIGFFAGLAILVDYQAVIASGAVGVYLLLRSPRRVRDSLLALVGTLPALAALLTYHNACFGSPLTTGYRFAADPAHRQGLLGIIGPNVTAMHNALLHPSNGLLLLMPWILLAIVGAVGILRSAEQRKQHGPEAIVCAVVVMLYLLFVGSLVPEFGRAGWSVGPRYIAVAIPFAGWLAAAGLSRLDQNAWLRTFAQVSIFVGVLVYMLAASTYPHWPTAFANPVHEVSLRALAAGMTPHSVGTVVGLSGIWAVAPLYLVTVVLAGTLLLDKKRWWHTAVAGVLAATIVLGLYRLFPSTANAERPWSFIERTWEPR